MIRHLSKKRAKANRVYLKIRNEFLQENYICQAGLPGCMTTATELHHQAGRIGERLTDVNNFLAVCSNCHNQIHNEPAMAKEKGLSKSRLNKYLK